MKFKLSGIAVGVALMSSTAAFAGAPTLSDVFSASGITASGAVDVSYDWTDVDGAPGFHVFDVKQDSFSLHQINTSVAKDFGNGWGVNANIVFGDDANIILGGGDDIDLFQGGLSYTSGGFSALAGRFATLAGMEVVNPAGNINASRSLLFFFQPLVHTGVRTTYKFGDAFAMTGGVNNGAIVGKTDNNTSSTLELQAAITPVSSLSIYLTGYRGEEDAVVGRGKLTADVLDLVVNFSATDSLYFGLNADYFDVEDGTGGTLQTMGVAGYSNIKFGKARVALRGEYIDVDTGGAGSAWLREGTVTFGYACNDSLELLVEARNDKVDDGSFALPTRSAGAGVPNDDQNTATVKLIAKF